MDIEANMKEQTEQADSILQIWDECPESGKFKEWQERNLIMHAHRLAELVNAAHEYRFNRNPPA